MLLSSTLEREEVSSKGVKYQHIHNKTFVHELKLLNILIIFSGIQQEGAVLTLFWAFLGKKIGKMRRNSLLFVLYFEKTQKRHTENTTPCRS